MEELLPVKDSANKYFVKKEVGNFSDFSFENKLTIMQNTNPRFIKTREVAGSQIPYIPHTYAEKALNFLFNFRITNKIISKEITTRQVMVRNKKTGNMEPKTVYDCSVLVEFTFTFPNGEKETRQVFGTNRSYDNLATTPEDGFKKAASNSWVVVARTFGIGSDLDKREEIAYRRVEETQNKQESEMKASSNVSNIASKYSNAFQKNI
ncbi:MAG TPA: hypothetical protein PLQ36_01455 [Candidatus Gracilibacteria bacterium]|nr:hypothetical protein [Candidatus Gracilibacteria bacterium]